MIRTEGAAATTTFHPEFTVDVKKRHLGTNKVVVDSPYKTSKRQQAGVPEKELFQAPAKAQAQALKSVLKSVGTKAVSASTAGRTRTSSIQFAKTYSGHTLQFQSSKANVFIVPQIAQPDGAQKKPSRPGFVLRQAYKVINAFIPSKSARWNAELNQPEKAGARTVPHQFLTQQVSSNKGNLYRVYDGGLYKFDPHTNCWNEVKENATEDSAVKQKAGTPSNVEGESSEKATDNVEAGQSPNKAAHYDFVSPFPSGNVWALRNGRELVRISDKEGVTGKTIALGENIVSVAQDGNGLIALGASGRLNLIREEKITTDKPLSLSLVDKKGKAVKDTVAQSIASAGDAEVFIQASDGQMYKLAYDDQGKPIARQITTGLSEKSTLVSIAFVPDDTSASRTAESQGRVHALYAGTDGSVLTMYYDKEAQEFKPGWNLSDATMYTNYHGLNRVGASILPQNKVVVDRDGLTMGFRDGDKTGTLYAKRPDGDWERTSVKGVTRIKANPIGEERVYALQNVKTDGGEIQKIVRLNLPNLGDTSGTSLVQESATPAPGEAGAIPKPNTLPQAGRLHRAIAPDPETLLVGEAGSVRDFAIIEGYHGTESTEDLPGHARRHLCYVDNDGKLHIRDLLKLRELERSNELKAFKEERSAPAAPPVPIQGPAGAQGLDRIVFDNKGDLYAIAMDEADNLTMYRMRYESLDAALNGKHPTEAKLDWIPDPNEKIDDNGWTKIELKLDQGCGVDDISATYGGRLHLSIRDGDGNITPKRPLVMEYTPGIGLRPLNTRSAIDAIRDAAGFEFKLPGLPMVESSNEFLSFKTTDRPVGSNGPGWFKTKLLTVRGLGAFPKVTARAWIHSRNGYPAFRGPGGLYDSVKDLAKRMDAVVTDVREEKALPNVAARLNRLSSKLDKHDSSGALMKEVQSLYDELITNVDKTLDQIMDYKIFTDFNREGRALYREKKPNGFSDTDLKGDPVKALHQWMERFKKEEEELGGQFVARDVNGHSYTDRILKKLAGMLNGPDGDKSHRMYLQALDANPAHGRDMNDKTVLGTAKLMLNLRYLDRLSSALDTNIGKEDVPFLRRKITDIRNEYKNNPVREYSSYSFINFKELEAVYDVLYGTARRMSNWKHPLCITTAKSHGVATPNERRSTLLKLVKAELANLNDPSPEAVARRTELNQYLDFSRSEEHHILYGELAEKLERKDKVLMTRLDKEQRIALRNATVDATLGMKPKENYVVEHGLAFGIDPLAYVREYGFLYGFLGALFERRVTLFNEPLTGDQDLTTGFTVKALEKEKRLIGELAAGVGQSFGHGTGLWDHYGRVAAWAEFGLSRFDSPGMMMITPRHFEQTFNERMWDMADKESPNYQDLGGLMKTVIEREIFTHKGGGFEVGLHIIDRYGPNGYSANAWGAAYAMRMALPHAKFAWGREWEDYRFSGITLDGSLQPGIESHTKNQSAANVNLSLLSFRNWFNVPTPDDAMDQLGIGFGNNDTWWKLGFENKDNVKCELRALVPEPVSSDRWSRLLISTALEFRDQGDLLKDLLEKWKGKDITADKMQFGKELVDFKKAVTDALGDNCSKEVKEKIEEFELTIDQLRMRHYQALLGQNDMFGGIHELRVTNPNRLIKPSAIRTFGQWIGALNADKEAAKPIHKLHGWLDSDLRLGKVIKDMAQAHATRVKIKYEYRPDKVRLLSLAQLSGKNFKEVDAMTVEDQKKLLDKIDEDFKNNDIDTLKKARRPFDEKKFKKEFVFNPANCRIKTIEALSGNTVANSVLVAPVVLFGTSNAVTHEADLGTVLFNYDNGSAVEPSSFTTNAGHTIHRHSEQKVKKAFSNYKTTAIDEDVRIREMLLRKKPVEMPSALSNRHQMIMKQLDEKTPLQKMLKPKRSKLDSPYSIANNKNVEPSDSKEGKKSVKSSVDESTQSPPPLPEYTKKKLNESGPRIEYADSDSIEKNGGSKAVEILQSLPPFVNDDMTSISADQEKIDEIHVDAKQSTQEKSKTWAADDFTQQNIQKNAEYTQAFNQALEKLGIQAVYNSGSNGNCFIQCLLQHASEDYRNDFLQVAKEIREELEKEGLLQDNELMHSDTDAMKRTVELVNARYSKAKIWPQIVHIGPGGRPLPSFTKVPEGAKSVALVVGRYGLAHYEALVKVNMISVDQERDETSADVKRKKKGSASSSSTLSQLLNSRNLFSSLFKKNMENKENSNSDRR